MIRYSSSALLLLAVSAGCASRTPVAVVDKPDDVMARREVVLMCTVGSAPRPEFAGRDPKARPSRVAGGSITDAVLYVDGVLKGKFDQPTLRIKDADTTGGDPNAGDPNAVQLDRGTIHDGDRLRVGFDRGPFGVPTHITVAHEGPKRP